MAARNRARDALSLRNHLNRILGPEGSELTHSDLGFRRCQIGTCSPSVGTTLKGYAPTYATPGLDLVAQPSHHRLPFSFQGGEESSSSSSHTYGLGSGDRGQEWPSELQAHFPRPDLAGLVPPLLGSPAVPLSSPAPSDLLIRRCSSSLLGSREPCTSAGAGMSPFAIMDRVAWGNSTSCRIQIPLFGPQRRGLVGPAMSSVVADVDRADKEGGEDARRGGGQWRDREGGPSREENPISRPVPLPVDNFQCLSLAQLAELSQEPVGSLEQAAASLGLLEDFPVEERKNTGKMAEFQVPSDMAELILLELGREVERTKKWKAQLKKGVSHESPSPFPVSSQLPEVTERVTERVSGAECPSSWPSRAPVVTVMGHVDHGKTSLLDALRSTSVAAREAGGITQHIGAFVVGMRSGASLTFLDTPGHAAFEAMRGRGAAVTDLVVLVVAADDGVMPQTLESMRHAREAGVPLVVAVTKCDKPEADPARVEQQLLAEGVELESAGGDVQAVRVSSKTGLGLEQLEEALLLQAELMDLRGRREGAGEAVVVEARLGRGQGPIATVIVKGGELRPGCCVVVGQQWGKVRSLKDWSGRALKTAGPSVPVEVDGLKGLPEAGDVLVQVASEEQARKLSQARQEQAQHRRLEALAAIPSFQPSTRLEPDPSTPVGSSDSSKAARGPSSSKSSPPTPLAPGAEEGKEAPGSGGEAEAGSPAAVKELVVLVKADVQGSVEAVCCAIQNLSCSQVHVRVVHACVGPISQSDVDMADATGAAAVVAFNVRPMSAAVEAAAKSAGVELHMHRVIYRLLEDVGHMVIDAAPGTPHLEVSGQAQVLQLFEARASKRDPAQVVAGCRVLSGRLTRGGALQVRRRGEVVHRGLCSSLRREKADVAAIEAGTECGLTIASWDGVLIGDVVEFVEEEMRKPKLVSMPNGSMYID